MPSERRTPLPVRRKQPVRREYSPEDVTPEMMILGAALGILLVSLALYLA